MSKTKPTRKNTSEKFFYYVVDLTTRRMRRFCRPYSFVLNKFNRLKNNDYFFQPHCDLNDLADLFNTVADEHKDRSFDQVLKSSPEAEAHFEDCALKIAFFSRDIQSPPRTYNDSYRAPASGSATSGPQPGQHIFVVLDRRGPGVEDACLYIEEGSRRSNTPYADEEYKEYIDQMQKR